METENSGKHKRRGKAGGDSDALTGTLGKAVSLLELVTMAEKPLRFTDILLLSGQPRGTLHRQLVHLLAEGLLEQNGDQTYGPGARLLKFAARAWSRNDLRSIAARHLQALHELTGESVHLGMLRDSEIIYLDKVEGRQAVRMYSQIGKASPVYCTGVGKAALSALPLEELRQLLGRLDLRAFTPHTIVDRHALLNEIETIRRNGYGFDLEEHEVGIHCVAAPILTPGRPFMAALSVTGPAYRVSIEALNAWSGAVRTAADAIAADVATMLSPGI
jgi:DNA-binding IclR family transcriptional regulator